MLWHDFTTAWAQLGNGAQDWKLLANGDVNGRINVTIHWKKTVDIVVRMWYNRIMDNTKQWKKNRCGKCPACRQVKKVRDQANRALAQATVNYVQGLDPREVGEDVRLIWNRTLEENPCSED